MPKIRAKLGFAGARLELREMLERRGIGIELLELMRREVADLEAVPGNDAAAERRNIADQRLDQRRLAGAVRTQQADPRARPQRQLHRVEYDAVTVTRLR